MKKIFLSLLMFAASVNIFAVSYTAKVTVNITDNDGWESDMILAESADGTLYAQVNEENTATMYAKYDSKKCEQLRLATLGELPIGFKIAANSATLKVTAATGTALYLKDLTNDSIMELSLNREYAFTIENAQIAQFVENRFQLYVPKFYPREIASGKWGTICYEEAISSVEGATIYEFAGKNATQVAADPATLPLEKGKAYLFLATADAQKFFYTDATKATQVTANNGLIGKFTEYTTTADDADAYVIKGTSLVPAAVGSTIPANRAYVQKLSDIKGDIFSAPGRRIFNIVGTTTDLEAAEAAGMQDGKMMINGQLIIIKGGKMFNAQGMEL